MNPIENSSDWKNFVHNVRWLRESHHLSKKKMASILGIGTKTLEKIENGEVPERLSAKIFFRIWKHFGIHPVKQLADYLDK